MVLFTLEESSLIARIRGRAKKEEAIVRKIPPAVSPCSPRQPNARRREAVDPDLQMPQPGPAGAEFTTYRSNGDNPGLGPRSKQQKVFAHKVTEGPAGAPSWRSKVRRRKTTIGRGAFGHTVPADQHAAEVLDRILSRGLPLTEDAIFLAMHRILRRHNDSLVFRNVRSSKDVGGYRYFSFSPDINLLEVRPSGTVVAYELKGYRKAGNMVKAPPHYEGIHQALAMLRNPVSSPLSQSFAGSIFDFSYIVHPDGSDIDSLADLIRLCTPLGLIVVDHRGTRELVKPRPNPFLDRAMKEYFISRLDTLESYLELKVNPIQ